MSVNQIIIDSDNGMLPDQCQAIIGTYVGLLLIELFSEFKNEIRKFSFKKICLSLSVA